MSKLFIWDFHGTLEKGNEYASGAITNEILKRNGYVERMNEQDMLNLYGKRWYEYFAYALPDTEHEYHLELVEKCLELTYADFDKRVLTYTKATDHAHEVLSAIRESGHDQILISNSADKALDLYIKGLDMDLYFPKTKRFAMESHTGAITRSKRDVAQEYVAQHEPESVVIIGDSAKDVTIIKGDNVTSYLYSHPNKPFRDGCNPTYKINDLRKVLKEL